MLQIAWIQ